MGGQDPQEVREDHRYCHRPPPQESMHGEPPGQRGALETLHVQAAALPEEGRC